MLRALALDDLLDVLESGGTLSDSSHPLRSSEVRGPLYAGFHVLWQDSRVPRCGPW